MSPASRSRKRARVINKQSMCVLYSSAKPIGSLRDSQSGIDAVRHPRHARSLRVLPTAGGIADEGCLGLLAFVIAVAGSPHRTMAGAKPLNTTIVDISGNILAAERFTVELAEIYTGSG